MTLFVGMQRKDGKFPVTYAFNNSDRRIKKIITKEKLHQEIKDGCKLQGYSKLNISLSEYINNS